MEYIVDELKRDASKGSNFKIQFEEEITLERAVGKLVALLSSCSNKPQSHFIQEQREYGHIELQRGDLTIKDERVAFHWSRIDKPIYDVYRVTENNMDFEQLKNLYSFLQDL
ncbi:hypothetical protein KAJ87_03715 [Candidatus Pacearchaeota archaeon]|nr:hypothetical protein [Candidatus Pacearchaeota archaeon]